MEWETDITASAGPLDGGTSTMSTMSITTIVIVVVVIIIIVIALIVVYMRAPPMATAPTYVIAPGTLGQPCSGDTQCTIGYRCQAGVCKASLGTSCLSLADCTGDAHDCRQGICMAEPSGVLDGACPCALGFSCQNNVCKVAMGGPCSSLSDCTPDAQSCYYGQCSVIPPVPSQSVPTAPITDSLAPPVNPISRQELLNALLAASQQQTSQQQTSQQQTSQQQTSQQQVQVSQQIRSSCSQDTTVRFALPETITTVNNGCMSTGSGYVTKDYNAGSDLRHLDQQDIADPGDENEPFRESRGADDDLIDEVNVRDVASYARSNGPVFGAKTLYRPIKPIASLGRVRDNPIDTSNRSHGSTAIEGSKGIHGSTAIDALSTQYRSPSHDRVDVVARDVTYHRGDIIQLLTDRSIQVTDTRSIGKRYVSEYSISQMVSLGSNGTLGLGTDGNIYQQKNTTPTNGSLWRWIAAGWSPKNVITMNTTHNNDYLWLQSATHGHLYHIMQDPDQYRDPVLIEKVPMTNGNLRWYGNAKNEYVEYNPMTGQGVVMPNRQKINGAYRALLKPDGQIVTAPPSVRRLRWINGSVYYVVDRAVSDNN